MKRFQALVVVGMLSVGANAIAASGSLNEFKPRYMPVLVQVDSKGKVTDVSPSTDLSPRFSRLLHQNLDEMITQPATDHGRPVSSQFVINLALQVSPRKEGDYLANFAYVSSSPVPNGSWYWVKINGHRLALANRNDFGRTQRMYFNQTRGGYQPTNVPNSYQHAPTPTIQNAIRSTSIPVASPHSGQGH
ncbi:MAG TPA: hypothetical protein VGC19_10315 [Rhodanobacter sp.]